MTNADFYLEDLRSKFLKIDPAKYYLAYSGGKDSGMLFWFLRTWLKDHYLEMHEQYKQIPAVSVNTYLEWPDISRRMLDNADVVLTPKMKPHEVIAKVGTPCFSKRQDQVIHDYQKGCRTERIMNQINGKTFIGKDGIEYLSSHNLNLTAKSMLLNGLLPAISDKCCYHLKKFPSMQYEKESGRHPIMGVMAVESVSRKKAYKSCFHANGKFTPLWDCTEATMNEIYDQYAIPLPPIYKYINQTGCAGCPYGIGLGHTQIELQLMTPQKRAYVERLFGAAYRVRGLNYKQMDIFQYFEKINLCNLQV